MRPLARLFSTSIAALALDGSVHAQGYGKFAADICRVPDLDGNGRDELAISDEERRTIWIVDPLTGDVVRRITDLHRGGLELPGQDDFFGWSVESFSSSGGDFLTVCGGFPRLDSVPDQKIVDLATGRVVGTFHDGLLRATALPGVSSVLSIEPRIAVEPGPGTSATDGDEAEYEVNFRLLDTDTLCPTTHARLRGRGYSAACSPGDIGGDGHADLLVLRRVQRGTSTVDDLELYAFSGVDAALLYARSLCVADLYPGRVEIVPTGDVDGDGLGDCALRARMSGDSRLLWVSGADGTELQRVEVPPRTYLSALGDVDGDGVRDVALDDTNLSFENERNTIWVHSSKTGQCLYKVETPFDFMGSPEPSEAADAFGIDICDLGDVDGDGFDDFAASANDPMSYDGEFVAVISGRTGSFVKLLLGKNYRDR